MNTEKPMNTESSQSPDEHDKTFDGRLSKLYQAALLDETLQQQIRKDFQALPESGRAQLKPREQRLVQDEPQLSAAMRDKLLALAMGESESCVKSSSPPWWKTLLGEGGWQRVFLPRGMIGIPLASIAGVVVGSVVTVLILQESPPPEFQTRGGETQTNEPKQAPSVGGQVITEAVRSNPALWWAAIMALQQQPGKLPEAIDEMRLFHDRYPSYDPRSR